MLAYPCKGRLGRRGGTTMKEKIWSIGWRIYLVINISVLVILAFWLLYPYDVISVESPIKIMNKDKTVRAGGMLIYEVKYDKKMDVSGRLTRKLVNSYVVDLRPSIVTHGVGKGRALNVLHVPEWASDGEYYMTWSAEYKVNPIRTVRVTRQSEEFTVVKR